MMFNISKNTGFIQFIIIIIILILVISYFNIDIRGIVEAPQTQQNIGYVFSWVAFVWNEYLRAPATYLWNDVFLRLLWSSFVDNLEKIKRGQPNDFEANAPAVPAE